MKFQPRYVLFQYHAIFTITTVFSDLKALGCIVPEHSEGTTTGPEGH